MNEADVMRVAARLGYRHGEEVSARRAIRNDAEGSFDESNVGRCERWWLFGEGAALLLGIECGGDEPLLLVGHPTWHWDGPVPPPVLCVREVVATDGEDAAVREARRVRSARRKEFQRCQYCGRRFPPEWGDFDGATSGGLFCCHGCMETNLDVVF